MAKYRLYKNKNVKSTGYNKYYAKKAAGKLVDMDGLVQHMAGHNSPYSKGLLKGIVTDMVECIRIDHGDRFLNEFVEFTSNSICPHDFPMTTWTQTTSSLRSENV